MLEFREIDYQKDISEIVILIKKGLDKNYTEEFFKWKHIDNPFGKSYGLLAIDNGTIIGLRMFMYWEFKKKDEKNVIRAIRPVDTVVHNHYRGKGLFKKLTLNGLEACNGKYDLIFNTPNENSLPGYLKMNWVRIESEVFKMGFALPSIFKKDVQNGFTSNMTVIPKDSWTTNKNTDYLKWRYRDKEYKIVNYNNSFLIYSLSKTKIQNQIVLQEFSGESIELQVLVKHVAKLEKSLLFYYYSHKNLDKLFKFKTVRKKSVIVFRDDSNEIEKNISFSLGDLEGKL
tara:strand:+ start:181 stop:1038 length:858 start_codon:yes stop_codon:yes gene_type:complete